MPGVGVYIYGLVSPVDSRIYYIGVTINPPRRLRQHIRDRDGRSRKGAWLIGLRETRLTPIMVILERVQVDGDPFARERWWIGLGHLLDWPLTNHVPGDTRNEFTIALLLLLARLLADKD